MNLQTTPAVVCYLDLLGFSNRMMAIRESPDLLAQLQFSFTALKYSCEAIIEKYCDKKTIMWWTSDSCILVHFLPNSMDFPIVQQAIKSVATGAGIIQCFMAIESHGYFLRGAMTIDRMFDSGAGKEPSGPALTWAVQLEKDYAVTPRIIAHEYVYGASHDLLCDICQRKLFVFDFEMPFLDYLSFSELIDTRNPLSPIAWHAEEVHKFVVSAKSAPEFAKKAQWLHWYHNWHVTSRGNMEQLILRIDPPKSEDYENL